MSRKVTFFLFVWALTLATLWLGERFWREYQARQAAPRPVQPRAELTASEQNAIALFENAAPSVAYIFSETIRGRGPFGLEIGTGAGSGIVWDTGGHIVTNDHVVANAQQVWVQLNIGQPIAAKVIGRAPSYDLAVVELAEVPVGVRPIPIGSSSDLKVGQRAFAIGNPFGLSKTLTQGIVSALDRSLPTANQREISGAIQTDASINPGNSGGPLLDSAGRLIGVNTAILSGSGSSAGVGLAIPVDLVNRIVPDLIKRGKAPQPGIGIAVAEQAVAVRLGVAGVVVMGVEPGSPAAQAGVRPFDLRSGTIGDVIIAVDGNPTPSVSKLVQALDKAGIGATATLTIARGEQKLSISVRIIDIS